MSRPKVLKQLRSPAMLVALVALVASMASSSYAQPVRAQVSALITGKKIKNGSVTTADIKNRSLLRKDFKKGQLRAGRRGPAGPSGPAGPAGPQGRPGAPGASAVAPLSSGATARGYIGYNGHATGGGQDFSAFATLPAGVSVTLSNGMVDIDQVDEVNGRCTGNAQSATAPAGVVCVYPVGAVNLSSVQGLGTAGWSTIQVRGTAQAAGDLEFSGIWAYTAP
jgi:hypothetical protein